MQEDRERNIKYLNRIHFHRAHAFLSRVISCNSNDVSHFEGESGCWAPMRPARGFECRSLRLKCLRSSLIPSRHIILVPTSRTFTRITTQKPKKTSTQTPTQTSTQTSTQTPTQTSAHSHMRQRVRGSIQIFKQRHVLFILHTTITPPLWPPHLPCGHHTTIFTTPPPPPPQPHHYLHIEVHHNGALEGRSLGSMGTSADVIACWVASEEGVPQLGGHKH